MATHKAPARTPAPTFEAYQEAWRQMYVARNPRERKRLARERTERLNAWRASQGIIVEAPPMRDDLDLIQDTDLALDPDLVDTLDPSLKAAERLVATGEIEQSDLDYLKHLAAGGLPYDQMDDEPAAAPKSKRRPGKIQVFEPETDDELRLEQEQAGWYDEPVTDSAPSIEAPKQEPPKRGKLPDGRPAPVVIGDVEAAKATVAARLLAAQTAAVEAPPAPPQPVEKPPKPPTPPAPPETEPQPSRGRNRAQTPPAAAKAARTPSSTPARAKAAPVASTRATGAKDKPAPKPKNQPARKARLKPGPKPKADTVKRTVPLQPKNRDGLLRVQRNRGNVADVAIYDGNRASDGEFWGVRWRLTCLTHQKDAQFANQAKAVVQARTPVKWCPGCIRKAG